MTPSYCFEPAVYIRELFTCQLSLPNALQIQLIAATKSQCVCSVLCLTALIPPSYYFLSSEYSYFYSAYGVVWHLIPSPFH